MIDRPWLKQVWVLCKPNVVWLMLLTAFVGSLLAQPSDRSDWQAILFSQLGIAMMAAAGAAWNHLIDRHIDAKMQRTQRRPLPSGQLSHRFVMVFSCGLTLLGMAVLGLFVSVQLMVMTSLTTLGYAVVYTMILKSLTAQNIVIGGLSGSMPPLLGWLAVRSDWSAMPLLLVGLIYCWTPMHFWALAVDRRADYQRTRVWTLPVTHGVAFTIQSIRYYTIMTILMTVLLGIYGRFSVLYWVMIAWLNGRIGKRALQLELSNAMALFRDSIYYLMILFAVILFEVWMATWH